MSESEAKKPRISWITPAAGVPEYYANMVHILWSLDDVRFKIGQLIESNDDETKAVAKATAGVTLSWRTAKLLRDDLESLISSYEKVNGEITTAVVLAPTKGDQE